MTAPTPADLRALLAAGTPGEWAVDRVFWKIGSTRGMRDEFWTTVEVDGSIVATMPEEASESKPNAALIAAAVNALPDLLDEIQRGRELRGKVEALAGEWVGMGVMRSMTGTISAERGRDLRAVLAETSGL